MTGSPLSEKRETEKGLLIVAVRVDNPGEVRKRIETVLAIASTYDDPPDTTATAWAKWQSELVASDLDHLAYFMGWRAVRDLNVGDVVSPASSSGESDDQRAASGVGPAESSTCHGEAERG